MLRQLEQNLWVAQQPLKFLGLEVGTRMTVIRLDGGKLAVISPIGSVAPQSLEELGSVAYLIAPNLYHHLFMAEWIAAYPEAQFWSVPGLAAKCPHLPIGKVFGQDAFEIDEIDCLPLEGLAILPAALLGEYVFLHRPSRTLILTDGAFFFDRSFPPVTRAIAWLLQSYQQLRPTWVEKWATKDKEAVKSSIRRILDWDFNRVLMAHGSIIEDRGKQQLQEGYEWFLGTSLDS